MIHTFVKTCNDNGEKTAFIIKNKRISFETLLKDVYKMVNLFQKRNIPRGSRALLFMLPSYEFYVLLFACIYYGINIFVLDSYKDRGRILRMMKENDVKQVFCNDFTHFLRFVFPKGTEFLNVSKFCQCEDAPAKANANESLPVLTTFTSGTTGEPKPIERSVKFLKEQIETISKNVEINDSSVVFGGLPIYALFIVYSGVTCFLGGVLRKNQLKKYRVDTVLAPIALLLNTKGRCDFVRKTYCGGARLYQRDVDRLKDLFPAAKHSYIYGASECALIGITDLDYYVTHSFAIKDFARGVEVSLLETDENVVGKIFVRGASVLTEGRGYVSNDLGYLDAFGLHIVGRSKYSIAGAYNYLLDDKILSENERVKRGFALVYEGKTYFCYEGKITKKKADVTYVKFYKLPMDAKHKTKLDYVKTVALLKKKGL